LKSEGLLASLNLGDRQRPLIAIATLWHRNISVIGLRH